MSNIKIGHKIIKNINCETFILDFKTFEKIKYLLTKDINFYKYYTQEDSLVEIDIGNMIGIINLILLKTLIGCDLKLLKEINSSFYNQYIDSLEKLVKIYPEFNPHERASDSHSKRRIYCASLLRECINNNDTSKLQEFIEINYSLKMILSNIYKQRDIKLAKENVIDSLKYICDEEVVNNNEQIFNYYLDKEDIESATNHLKNLQKIILEDWQNKLTSPNSFVPGQPFRFLCHSTDTPLFQGDFYNRFVSTSLLTEEFTTTYRECFGFIMNSSNIVLASGHDMFVDNSAKELEDILPTTIPVIDSIGRVLNELSITNKVANKERLLGHIYSEIVIDGFNPIAIFCLSNGSKELNANYRNGKLLSDKFNLPLIDIDLTLYKSGLELMDLKNELIKDIEVTLSDSISLPNSDYINDGEFFKEFMELKKGGNYTFKDVINLYIKNRQLVINSNDISKTIK